jgi:hypothetical protein
VLEIQVSGVSMLYMHQLTPEGQDSVVMDQDGVAIRFAQAIEYRSADFPTTYDFVVSVVGAVAVGVPSTLIVDWLVSKFRGRARSVTIRNLHQIGPAAQTADWSPDGAHIVFGSVDYIDVPRPGSTPGLLQYYDIYTVRPDGTDLRRLTTDQISTFPSWTADGRIAFFRVPLEQTRMGLINKIGPRQFWIMDADGGNATQLSVSPQLIDQAAWPISWPPQP